MGCAVRGNGNRDLFRDADCAARPREAKTGRSALREAVKSGTRDRSRQSLSYPAVVSR